MTINNGFLSRFTLWFLFWVLFRHFYSWFLFCLGSSLRLELRLKLAFFEEMIAVIVVDYF